MTPARLDLRVWRNAVFPLDEFRLEIDGSPIDLTGAVVEFQVRLADGTAGAALIDCSSADVSGDRIDITSPTLGRFQILVSEMTHEALPAAPRANVPARFRYDLRVDLGDGFEPYLWGDYIVQTGVSQ